MRSVYTLTKQEAARFEKLPKLPEVAFEFWRGVAAARNVDPKSILTPRNDPYQFSALPVGHGKPWCYPFSIRCNPV